MDEEKLRAIASQLRKPQGEMGKQVGVKMNEGNAHINLYAIQQLQISSQDNILEIGMGNGFFVQHILTAHPSVRYTGCDMSDIMVEQARQVNESFVNKGQAQFFLANAGNLPFTKKSFDKVFTVNTIYFWDDAQKILAQIRNVLKPGGLLVIAIRPKQMMKLYPFVKYGFTMYSKEELASLLTRYDFKVTNIFEKEEPSQEINGELVKVEALIISAVK